MSKAKKTVCFIVDGNKKIGLGHLFRCKSIATELLFRGNQVVFIVPDQAVIRNVLNFFNCTYVPINIWNNINGNINYFNSLISEVDIVVLDLLEDSFLEFSFLEKIKKKIVSITSFYYSEINRYEDISIFPGMEEKEFDSITTKNKRVILYSGSKYLALREEFIRSNVKYEDQVLPSILVTMGGADPYNFTTFVVETLKELDRDFVAHIIIGSAASSFNDLKSLCEGLDNFHIYTDVSNMSEMMGKSSIGIINGGITRYEMACIGIPFIALSIHKVQYYITELLTSGVGGVNLGIKGEFSSKNLREEIENLLVDFSRRKEISLKLKKLIDGKGTNRIASIIEKA